MKIKQKNILKWIGEGVLIIISVLLAFIIDEQRQKSNQKAELTALLRDLKESFKMDSIILNARIFYLTKIDSLNKETLASIDRKSVPQHVDELDLYNPLNNYSLQRVLNNESTSLLSLYYQRELSSYNSWLNYVNENYDKRYDHNCQQLEDMIYENGEGIVFTQKFKGLVSKNIYILEELIINDSTSRSEAHQLILKTDREITLLNN